MLKKVGLGVLGTGTLGYGAVYSFSEDLRVSHYRVLKACVRATRLGWMGCKMAWVYSTNPTLSTEEKHVISSVIMKDTFRANAGLFIKLGQLLASLELIIPLEFVETMRELYQAAPTSDYEHIKNTIEGTFGQKIEDIFTEFSKTPISSASIAQVHEARLKSTGQKVAVKVQHAWLKEEVHIDTKMTELFVEMGQLLFKDFQYRWLVEDLKQNLPQELDFRIEAKNGLVMKEIFKNQPSIKVPHVYSQYSSDKILTMEFVTGCNVDNIQEIKNQNLNLSEVSYLLGDCFAQQIFKHGIVHADPHSGNVFVRKLPNEDMSIWQRLKKKWIGGKDPAQIVLLDHGLYKYLTTDLRVNYSYLWKGLITQNEDMIKQAIKNIGIDSVYYRLFAGMVTAQDWDRIMDPNQADLNARLEVSMKKDELNVTRAKTQLWMKQILHCLQTMDQDLLLIFKVNDYLRTLDCRLGRPVNTFYFTAKYSFWNIYEHEKAGKTYWQNICSLYQREAFLIKLHLAGIYFSKEVQKKLNLIYLSF